MFSRPLTEMRTRNEHKYVSDYHSPADAWGYQPHHRLWADCLPNAQPSTSHNTIGLHGLLQVQVYFYMYMMFVPHIKHNYKPVRPVPGRVLVFLYVGKIRTSREAHASTVCYAVSFTFLYLNDVRTSQEAPMGIHGLLGG
jgi:hypothetical protein